MLRLRWALPHACVVAVATSACTLAELNQLTGDSYALDAMDRSPPPSAGPRCHPEALIRYRGTWVKLEPSSAVAPPFAARLEQFEELLAQLGQQVYGRAPTKILHAGTYVCRDVANQTTHLSEHALGNAIDVTGFSFPALPATAESPASLPPRLRSSFRVMVLQDYAPKSVTPTNELHQRFFSLLIQALNEREIFRGMIGPPDPTHRTHLHLDMAPWPYRRLSLPAALVSSESSRTDESQ
ncbi:MAG TPA: extensin family protein [Polyangiaceae bacterium]|nr:extensin family protein [Polyangiaceae bacterium]